MDALIRAARVGPIRTRLRSLPVQTVPPVHGDEAQLAHDRLREEIESRVRSEMASQMQALCDAERERARAEGYSTGLAQAQAAAQNQLEETRSELQARAEAALSALSRAHEAALTQFESSIGEVSFAAVCRLVGREAARQCFAFGLVEQMCAPLRSDAIATARLHPRDIDVLDSLIQGESLAVRSLGLRVIADEALELGGCVIESATGDYDGGLEAQLRRLHAVLTGDVDVERPALPAGATST